MKKYFCLLLFLIISCTSTKINMGLKLIGAYDDHISLTKLSNGTKEVVFMPMIHIGTELFYEDVRKKVDSLENLGFFTYYEKVNANINDSILLRKAKKFQGFPFSKTEKGYMNTIDSIYPNLKLKKKLIGQPKYSDLGIDTLRSRNVDVTLDKMIKEYEKRFGEIKLNDCDFKTSIYEKSICDEKPIDKKNKAEIIVGYRNENVINELLIDKNKKIIIIYGKEHFIGIKEELLKKGYKEEVNNN